MLMVFLAFLSALIPQLVGLALVFALWPDPRPLKSYLPVKLCLATGIGFGISSCLLFAQLSLYGPSRGVFIAVHLILLAVLVAVSLYRARAVEAAVETAPETDPPAQPAPRQRLLKALPIAFFIALVSTVITFIFASLKRPHGEWDAWAVYNMKARFIFRGGANWKDVLSQPMYWAGPDYPLLIPSTIASCWTLLGSDLVAVPSVVAMFFTLATIGLVASSTAKMRSRSQGFLAGLIVMCTPYYIIHGADQYADIPIGFFFLATIVLLNLHDRREGPGHGFLILAGITAGLAAWTKNEGNLFIIAILASRFVVIARQRPQWKPYVRQALFFAAGVVPILLAVIYLKYFLSAVPNALMSPRDGPTLIAKLLDFSRYRVIGDYFIRYILGFGHWAVTIVPLLWFYLLIVGSDVNDKEKRSIVASFMTLGIMLAGYFLIYVISPRDLAWHIITSMDRLLSQLWPSFVFLIFLTARTPERAFQQKEA